MTPASYDRRCCLKRPLWNARRLGKGAFVRVGSAVFSGTTIGMLIVAGLSDNHLRLYQRKSVISRMSMRSLLSEDVAAVHWLGRRD